MRWFLLTDRTLKGFQLYGPFENPDLADAIARELLRRNRIKGWTVVLAQVPPSIEKGVMVDIAEF